MANSLVPCNLNSLVDVNSVIEPCLEKLTVEAFHEASPRRLQVIERAEIPVSLNPGAFRRPAQPVSYPTNKSPFLSARPTCSIP